MNDKTKIISLIATLLIIGLVILLVYNNQYKPPVLDAEGSTPQGVKQVVKANNEFAFKIYPFLVNESENKNVFYSPYSLSSAFAVLTEGANGKTKEEIDSVFGFPSTDILRPNFAEIFNEINSGSKDYSLRTANDLWIQKDFKVLPEYLKITRDYYGAKVTNLDFVRETEKSRQIINHYIEKQTNGKITNLIPYGMLDSNTRLVITNAVYFKGKWEIPFKKDDTELEDFFTPSGVVKVPMMNKEDSSYYYAETDKIQALKMLYKGDKLSMIILLPKRGKLFDLIRCNNTRSNLRDSCFTNFNYSLSDINDELSTDNLRHIESRMKKVLIRRVSIPKFKFDTAYDLKGVLKRMGMQTVFGVNSADLSRIDGKKDLFVSETMHKAYIDVYEEGTEAAAATFVSIGFSARARPFSPIIFRADHPFVFLIQDESNGEILFMGRVGNPTQ